METPDASVDVDATTPLENDGGEEPGTPVYAIITQVFATMGQTSYVVLTDDVGSPRTLDLADSLEQPGRAIGAGPAGAGVLFVGTGDSGSVTRYELSPDGTSLSEGESVSFAGQGVTSIGEYQDQFQFVSESKAYYFDARSAQMIVWNPSDMTVTGAVDLSELVVEGAVLTFSTNAVRRAHEIAIPLGWRSDVDASIPSEAGVLVVDTTSDATRVLRDHRCGYVRSAVEGDDGRLYLATEAYGSAVHRVVPANAAAPCLLRLDAEWSAFDGAYHHELSTLVGGATAGSLLPGPTPSEAWIRVLDESIVTVMPDTHPRVLASSPAWAWWQISLGDAPAAMARPVGVSNGSEFVLNASDAPVIPQFAADRSQTVLRAMADGTPGESTVTVPGLVFSLVRLR